MAQTLTVTNVIGPREWTGQYGTNHSYDLTLDGIDKIAELTQKPHKAAPQVGEALELELTPHPTFEGKLKAKRAFQQGGAGNGRPRDPVERRSIEAQHAEKCAVDVVRLAIDAGAWKPASVQEATEATMAVARKLFALVEELAA